MILCSFQAADQNTSTVNTQAFRHAGMSLITSAFPQISFFIFCASHFILIFLLTCGMLVCKLSPNKSDEIYKPKDKINQLVSH